MKIKKKVTLSALTSLVAVALAGSVTSTIAWYQYSTRANVAYLGSSAGTSGNLQLRIKALEGQGVNPWTTQLSKESVQAYLVNADYDLSLRQPVTPSLEFDPAAASDDVFPMNKAAISLYDPNPSDTVSVQEPKFYANPIFGRDNYGEWTKAKKGHYISFPLELRYVSHVGDVPVATSSSNPTSSASYVHGGINPSIIERDVFISDLLIQQAKAGFVQTNPPRKDISDAVRVHIQTIGQELDENEEIVATKNNFLISKNGGTTVSHGRLDLDGDGLLDKAYDKDDMYGFESELHDVIYGINSVDNNVGTTAILDESENIVGYEMDEHDSDLSSRYTTFAATLKQSDKDAEKTASSLLDRSFWEERKHIHTPEEEAEEGYQFDTIEDGHIYSEKVAPIVVTPDTSNNTLDITDLEYYVRDGELSEDFEEPVEKPGEPVDKGTPYSKCIGKTIAFDPADPESEEAYLTVVVTIWVEGWHKFNQASIWNTVDYLTSYFNVGIQFAVRNGDDPKPQEPIEEPEEGEDGEGSGV